MATMKCSLLLIHKISAYGDIQTSMFSPDSVTCPDGARSMKECNMYGGGEWWWSYKIMEKIVEKETCWVGLGITWHSLIWCGTIPCYCYVLSQDYKLVCLSQSWLPRLWIPTESKSGVYSGDAKCFKMFEKGSIIFSVINYSRPWSVIRMKRKKQG